MLPPLRDQRGGKRLRLSAQQTQARVSVKQERTFAAGEVVRLNFQTKTKSCAELANFSFNDNCIMLNSTLWRRKVGSRNITKETSEKKTKKKRRRKRDEPKQDPNVGFPNVEERDENSLGTVDGRRNQLARIRPFRRNSNGKWFPTMSTNQRDFFARSKRNAANV